MRKAMRNSWSWKSIWFAAALAEILLAAPAWAAEPAAPLVVIDAGPAVPTSPYLSRLIAGEDQPGVLDGVKFPIRTRLVPGRLLGPLPVLDSKWLTQPIIVLGADDVSIAWLTRYQLALHRQGAVGLVLAAETSAAFKLVQRAAQDVPVAPGPDRWLEDKLIGAGVRVLPVLIQLDGVAVQWPQGATP